MKNVITNAAEITVLRPIDYETYKTGGGPVSVGATVVEAPKGLPLRVLRVTQQNWQSILGKPFSKKVGGSKMEGLRHLADALRDCNYVNVVRVVGAGALFPHLTLSKAGVVAPGASAFGTSMVAGDTETLAIYIVDGDKSANRKLLITCDDTTKRATITLFDEDENGDDYVLERHVVGVDVADTDDMGQNAFIETVLERDSTCLRCDYNEDVIWDAFVEDVESGFEAGEPAVATPVAFAGGSDGGVPDTEDFDAAWDLFRNESVACDLMFAAGVADEDVLSNCIDIAELRHCTFLFDVSSSIKHDAAITWLDAAGLDSRQAKAYHSPFAANDPYYGGKAVWGVSGEMASAHARGDQNFTGAVPGIHYAAAGEKRARLQRTGVVALFPDDILDRDALYTSRINPIIVSGSGGAVCDDDLALYHQENYSRFGWVNRILNYIDHRFVQAARAAKFEPDGLTYKILYRLTKEIMEDLVTSGALVKPRDESYGESPYIIEIEQLEIDLWQVTWKICPTGAARRIAGQPWLIK